MNPELHDLPAELVVQGVLKVLRERSAGHCVRVDELPTTLASEACRRLQSLVAPPDVARFVTLSPEAPWQVTPTRAVSLRNEEDAVAGASGVLVIFVPPNIRLSVEDSIGVSTFEVLRFAELGRDVRAAALAFAHESNPQGAEIAAGVVDELLRDPRYRCDDMKAADYLLAVGRGNGAATAGVELTRVGLIPDKGLSALSADERRRRLQLNDQQMSSLEETAAPAERLRSLPIDPSSTGSKPLLSTLQTALKDGSSNRFRIAGRLRDNAEDVDYAKWDLDSGGLFANRFEITGLLGDFEEGAEQIIRKADPSIGVRFSCEPAPAALPTARALRLEILAVGRDSDDLHETGISATKTTLPRTTSSTWRRKVAVGETDAGLDAGLYRFRLILVANDNTEAHVALSEIFRVGEELEPTSAASESVLGLRDAAVKAINDGLDPIASLDPAVVLAEDGASVDYTVRFEGSGKAWVLAKPRVLADFEAQLISDASLRGFEIDLQGGLGEERWLRFDASLPEPLAVCRAELFKELKLSQRIPETRYPAVALADLMRCAPQIKSYIQAWVECLRSADPSTRASLLSTDQVHVLEDGALVAILLAPTHPLRLCWLARCDELLTEWTANAANLRGEELKEESAELGSALDDLVPVAVPPVVLEGARPFRFTDALTRDWGLWSTAESTDRMATTARVRRWLGLPSWRLGVSGEAELVSRVGAYLEAHPYVRTLVLNIVQPGEADLVLRLLGQLQSQFRSNGMSFVLRLFGDTSGASLGRALDTFMVDPEGSRSVSRDVAEELTRPSPDPLSPKLAYSKHDVAALVARPEAFPAHISLFLDYFAVDVAPLPEPPHGRSFFAGGILIEPVQRYLPGDGKRPPCWVNAVSVTDAGLFQEAFRAAQHATAHAMGGTGLDPTPALRLDVDSVSQAVLNAVHRSSDWVVVVDPVFSDEFLDRPGPDDPGPTYVIDMQSGADRPGGRNVVVSSRLRQEQSSLLLDAGNRFGFSIPPERGARLMEGLHTLGAGVALRLLMDERRAKEALSLALAALHLEATGILRHGLVVPVDPHQDLFAEARARGVSSILNRTDLAVFQLNPSERRIGIHLIEVKVRSSLGSAGEVPVQLAAEINEQLSNTERILLSRLFGAQVRDRQFSLAGALQLRRLTVLLRRYLSRAFRHGLLADDEAQSMGDFVESLQHGFRVGTSMHGLVFHASGEGERVEEHEGVRLTVAGRDYVDRLLRAPYRAATMVAGRGPDEYLRTVFTTVRDWNEVSSPRQAGFADEQEVSAEPDTTDVEADAVPQEVPGPSPDQVDLLGATPVSEQFGVVGLHSMTRRPVAIDMWGTNVVSVFGVQGSGKSYTVGALLEAALVAEPALNRLPSPLGGVVFHYSSDQTYVPEFVSMRDANEGESAVDLATLGASPRRIEDLVVLVPNGVLDRRRQEYGDVTVEPILLGPKELQLADWKLLMGIAEGNQMYAKAMSLILGELRANVSLARLREAIQESELSSTQKATALHRIKFTEPYVQEGANVAAFARPGRLVIVDLRDELIDKGEALSLFMVLLNRFTQAKDAGRNFNKIIVFDEAHKYMDDPALTDAITEAVREMRHKGASIVVASQNPPSVPQEIIELSSVIFAHKFTSPAWLRHLQKVSHAFGELRGSQLTDLPPGSAYVWAAGNARYLRPQRVQMRSRLTRHGGETRRATE